KQSAIIPSQSLRKKGAAGLPTAPVVPITRRCGKGRLRSSRLSFPADEATSRCREVRACPQRVLQTAVCCAGFGFALQRNDSSDNSTSFREHFSHNGTLDRKSTRLNSSHVSISYAVFCLKKK